MKQLVFTLLFSLAIGNVLAQYQGTDCQHWDSNNNGLCDEYYYYDAHDVDKLLAIQAANPQANLNWSGNNYASWRWCTWTLGNDNLKHLTSLITNNPQLLPSTPPLTLDLSGCTSLKFLEWGGYIALTSLDVSGCTSLTSLTCNSLLTSLDFSGCTNLTELRCSGSQLTSLDVRGLTSLTYLSWYYGRLTSLDVSGCTSLTSLSCQGNQLTSLDVSECTSLTYLDCEHNQLTSLNMSGCTSLTSFSRVYHDDNLTSLDVSGCTKLTDLTDDFFYNYNLYLTSLNVSGCTSLSSLDCRGLTSLNVSGCTNLTYLDCFYNQLTSLDVSGLTSLTSLDCSYNDQLTSLDVSGLTSLTSLDCSYNDQLTSLNVSGLTSLTGLPCNNNQLTSLDVSGLTSLTYLDCRSNQLTSLNVSECNSLTSLYCSNNQLTDENLPSLYGLNIETNYIGILYKYFDLRGNKGFHESAIRKLADNLPNISYEQILYDKIPETDSLTVSPDSLNFPAFGGWKTFDIKSNTEWTVSCDSTWVTFSPSSGTNDGTVTVTTTANPDSIQRMATIE